MVRRELRAYGGKEMDTAGDGVLGLFETPERAVRCAESIISGVGPLGLESLVAQMWVQLTQDRECDPG